MTASSPHINCAFNALPVNRNQRRFVITGVQLVLAILALGAVVWIGDAVAGGIDDTLGEKKLRDRD
jgi:hypothetical protein